MNQTLKEFITECELYAYSNEAYQLLKECTELQLMETYLENQEFLMNNQELVTSGVFAEGYFAEAINKETVLDMAGKAVEKAKGISSKIWNGFLKALRAIKTFLQTMMNKLTDIGRRSDAVKKELESMKLTNEDWDQLKELIDGIKNKDSFKGNTIAHKLDDRNFQVKLNHENQKGADRTYLAGDLTMALSNSSIVLFGKLDDGYAIPIDILIDSCKKLLKGKKKYQIDSVVATIEGATADVKKNGLVIYCNVDKIGKMVKELENITPPVGVKGSEEIIGNKNSELLKTISNGYQKLIQVIGSTLAEHTRYINFRMKAVPALEGWLKSRKKTA